MDPNNVVVQRTTVVRNTQVSSTTNEVRDFAIQTTCSESSGDESSDKVLLDFTSNFLFSDVELIVEAKSLYAHRSILSMWSPVFKAMFCDKFKESSEPTVVLKEDTFDSMKEILEHIYTPGGKEIDYTVARDLLPVLHRYQISALLDTAEKKLIQNVNDYNVLELLLKSDLFMLKKLHEKCISQCSKMELAKLEGQLSETAVPNDLLTRIYKARIRILEQSVVDIQRSFNTPCRKSVSTVEKVPANHCKLHTKPLGQCDEGKQCADCVDAIKNHIQDICKFALHKTQIVVVKDSP